MTPQEIAKTLLDAEDYEHTQRVVAFCFRILPELPNKALEDVDQDMLIDTGWLHDVGKSENADKHHKKKHIRKALEPYEDELGYDDDEIDDLVDIIHAHKGDFDPPPYYELESAILRLCDKMDRFNKGQSNAPVKCDESKDILKLVMKCKFGKKTWRKFRRKYWAILADTIQSALKNEELDRKTRERFEKALKKAQNKSS